VGLIMIFIIPDCASNLSCTHERAQHCCCY